MDQVRFRAATLDDLQTLLTFEQGVVTAERPFEPTLRPGNIHYYDLKHLITSDQAHLIVGLVGNEIVCCGYGKIMEAKPFQIIEQYLYIGFMYVSPQFRGQGLSQQILDELQKWSIKQNIKEVRLDVYADNKTAVRAYEKGGFKQHLITMRFTKGE